MSFFDRLQVLLAARRVRRLAPDKLQPHCPLLTLDPAPCSVRFCTRMFVGKSSFMRPIVALALAGGIALAAFTAFADRASADRTATMQIFQLQPDGGAGSSAAAAAAASAAGSASASAVVSAPYSRPLAEARNALARADNAAAGGDTAGARLLEGLAREWAELAQDVARAEQATSDAGALQLAAADAAQRVHRARAMLDELAGRKARATGELKELVERADAAPPVPKVAPSPKPGPAPKKGQTR
jgi:hypothetical protein